MIFRLCQFLGKQHKKVVFIWDGKEITFHKGVHINQCVHSSVQSCIISLCINPGRTFLGKRRYFSGIAVVTPLTPLTYKQNAVNAFILTIKTPLTPLYRQGTPLMLLYQKKLVSSKNLIFSLHEEWETHGQSCIWQRITKLLEHISSKMWKNCRRLESVPECGGIGSVIELAMAKQKIDHFTTWLVGVLQKFWQF